MKVAVVLFRDQVAPRFGATRMAALVTVEHATEMDRRLIDLGGVMPEEIPGMLAAEGAEVLICGGIHPRFEALFARRGVKVIGGVVGPAEEALAAFRAGELAEGGFRCHRPGRGCHGRRGGRGGRRGGGWQGPQG